MDMSACSTNTWVKFFKTAGIPDTIAATYAIVFTTNRMQMDMLLDLNREYLREMGITTMGDIISILRHAKLIHEQMAQEKVLGNTRVPVAAVTSLPTNLNNAKPSTPATRTLGHYIRTRESPPDEPESPSPPAVAHTPDRQASWSTPIVRSSTPPSLPLTAKKPRRVLPEHEGGYKVILPQGNTARSKQILAKKALLLKSNPYAVKAKSKSGVFSRLGSSNDSGSESNSLAKTFTHVKITGIDSPCSSVFARLGGKSEEKPPMNPPKRPLEYAGILKQGPIKAFQKKVTAVHTTSTPLPTMRADEKPLPTKQRIIIPQRQKVSFNESVVVKSIHQKSVIKPVKINANVKRLGHSPQKESVKARLGKSAKNILHKTVQVVPSVAKRTLKVEYNHLKTPRSSGLVSSFKMSQSGVFKRLG